MKHLTLVLTLLLLSSCHPPGVEPEPPVVAPEPPGSGGDGTGGDSSPVNGITVSGRVLDAWNQGLANAKVLIPGNGRQAVSVDGSGAFLVTGVVPPYVLIIADPAKRIAAVYEGLTLQSPTLVLRRPPEGERKGTVSGSFLSPTPPDSAHAILVSFASKNADASWLQRVGSGNTYSFNPSWSGGATSTTGSLYALLAEGNLLTSVPKQYVAFGRRDNVTLTADTRLAAQDIPMASITTARLTGRLSLPAHHSVTQLALSLTPSADSSALLFFVPHTENTFDFAVPRIPGMTFSLTASALINTIDASASTLSVLRGLTTGATPLVRFRAAALPIHPVAQAKAVTRATQFMWSPFEEGVHKIDFRQSSGVSMPFSVTLFTRASQATLPDLSAVGMAWPASSRFSWSIAGYSPVPSVDALVQLSEGGALETLPSLRDFAFSSCTEWIFTTAAVP